MKTFIAILTVCSIQLHSSWVYSQDKDRNETKQVMHQALDSLIHLIPYNSELKFNDANNTKIIDFHLNRIANAFKSAKHIKDFKSPSFTPNYQVIKEHLDDTIMAFNNNNKVFARLRFNATTSICMSCHTQLPQDQMTSYLLNSEKVNRNYFANEYEHGNFQFLIRSYHSAISTYKRAIRERIAKRDDLLKIQNILGENYNQFDKILFNTFKKILIIYTRILRQPESAIELFNKYIGDKKIPHYIQQDLKNWIQQLERWKGNKDIQKKYTQDEQLQAFINKYVSPLENQSAMSGDYDIDLLITSGVLSNYLHQNPKTKFTGDILYLEGIAENRIDKNIFFTLGDLYLKECILRYPKTPIAKKCFNEYKEEITLRYTGSIGTNIPNNKKRELEKLKKLIQ